MDKLQTDIDGLLSRVSQQVNIFASGVPVTLSAGLTGVMLTLSMRQMPFTMALEPMQAKFQ